MAGDKNGVKTPISEELSRRAGILVPSVVVLAGAVLSYKGNDYWSGVGGNLIAAGVVALLAFALYGDIADRRRRAEISDQTNRLKKANKALKRLEDHNRLDDVARRVGLDACYEERPSKKIRRAVLEATDRVDILEVSLDTIGNMESDVWLECAADVRIILLDPLFPKKKPLALLRDREEKQADGTILREVHEIVNALPSEWMESSDGAECRVKLAKVMPTMSYFRIDGVAYFAPLVHKTLGNETMHMRFREDGDFFEVLEAHFEKLWKNTSMVKPVDPTCIQSEYPFGKK